MPAEPKQKSRAIRASDRDPTQALAKAAQHVKPGPKPKQAHRSSAILRQDRRQNLTQYDWLQVVQHIDKNPGIKQKAVVDYFATRSTAEGGRLLFTQGALSKHLKPDKKEALLKLAAENSAALSNKRERIVTSPEVDRALGFWVLDMEQKRRSVTGAMLIEQRKRFEEALKIPDDRRLRGTGWLDSFKKAHGLIEWQRHGEAASVNLEAVDAERKRLVKICSRYAPEDIWNADETSFFPSMPPDRTLCTAPMNGTKQDKFRISALVACNSTGTEKLDLMFIGKFMKPRVFRGVNPANMDPPLYYRANKKAWMTAELWTEWIRKWNDKLRRQKRHILLLIDNCPGHVAMTYKPSNIRVEFLEPNMTSFVQPCDAGIIRCLKAHYRQALAIRV
ncbi:unnamed protein product [Mycena citricolor]|uniref:HTH CENPB-type domain-containing protein n=1 Tax=Mycena citricolor TaxID=2018698 RepID=A0AAD2HFH5_9AGAR|nr:unnamed protein product [Mycena citricolor]